MTHIRKLQYIRNIHYRNYPHHIRTIPLARFGNTINSPLRTECWHYSGGMMMLSGVFFTSFGNREKYPSTSAFVFTLRLIPTRTHGKLLQRWTMS
jgi:hypothetical protein